MALHQTPRNPITAASQSLVDAYLRLNGATHIQPAGVPGNEASRATRELIAKRRREFRKANKG